MKTSYLEIGIPNSLTAETGQAVASAENLIECYENEGKKILKLNKLPVDIVELWKEKEKYLPDIANSKGSTAIYRAFWMLLSLASVRISLEENNTEKAIVDMTVALNWASKLQIEPFESLIARYKNFPQGVTNPRHDNLSKAMIKAWETFQKEVDGNPSCRNIFDWLEVKGKIQEKDTESEIIYWIDGNKKEQKTKWGAFKNRYTKIKREMTKK